MRRLAPILFASAFTFAAGYTLGDVRPPHHERIPDDYAHPETIELYRPACGELPEVADTVRFTAGGRPAWVVRIKYGHRIITYRGEAINHPPVTGESR